MEPASTVTHLRESKQTTPKHVCRILVNQDKYMETWVIVSIALIMKGDKTKILSVLLISVLLDKLSQNWEPAKLVQIIKNQKMIKPVNLEPVPIFKSC